MPKIKSPKKLEKCGVKQVFIKCKKCGDEIFSNTHKKMINCKCQAIAVDGCEYYIRIIGDEENYKVIKK